MASVVINGSAVSVVRGIACIIRPRAWKSTDRVAGLTVFVFAIVVVVAIAAHSSVWIWWCAHSCKDGLVEARQLECLWGVVFSAGRHAREQGIRRRYRLHTDLEKTDELWLGVFLKIESNIQYRSS